MKLVLLLTALCGSVKLCTAGDYTVTDEAWFDVEVADYSGEGETYSGRIEVALFGEAAPMTVLNFLAITRGYTKDEEILSYQGTTVHRIVQDFLIQMGDITNGDGTGGRSIYGERFNDESFTLSHVSPGWMAMANHGKDTNNSQFYMLLTRARWLDGKHVVFGKVIRGFDVLMTLGDLPSDDKTAFPEKEVLIADCGVTSLDSKYELPENVRESTSDWTP